MRCTLSVMLSAALLASAASLAAPAQKPPRGHLGSEWVGADGNMRHPQIGLVLKPPKRADIYRDAALDWKNANIQNGPYPPKALKAEKEGIVQLRLTISADGKPLECSVTVSSDVPEFDAHACPQIISFARFHPALNSDGARTEITQEATLSYQLRLYIQVPSPFAVFETTPAVRAKVAVPVALETLGITEALKTKTSHYGVGAWVTVGTDGKPLRCWMASPTFNDEIDYQVCDRLMKDVTYTPAHDKDGQAVEDRVSVHLNLR